MCSAVKVQSIMKALQGCLDPTRNNKLIVERRKHELLEKKLEGTWGVYQVEETVRAKVLRWKGSMDEAQREELGWNQTMKNLVGHGELGFTLWTVVNHLDINQGSDLA